MAQEQKKTCYRDLGISGNFLNCLDICRNEINAVWNYNIQILGKCTHKGKRMGLDSFHDSSKTGKGHV